MRKSTVNACLIISLTIVACGGTSNDFRKEGRYLFYALSEHGLRMPQQDFDSAVARAEAAQQNEADEKTMRTLKIYGIAMRSSDGSAFALRLWGACQWEAAQALDIQLPETEGPHSPGDCEKLTALATDRGKFIVDCMKKNPGLNKLMSREKNGNFDEVGRRMTLEREVTANCTKEADVRFLPD